MGFMSKTTILYLYHPCCKFLCRECTTTTWNGQILSLLRNGDGKPINFNLCLNRTRSRPFSSKQPNFPIFNYLGDLVLEQKSFKQHAHSVFCKLKATIYLKMEYYGQKQKNYNFTYIDVINWDKLFKNEIEHI